MNSPLDDSSAIVNPADESSLELEADVKIKPSGIESIGLDTELTNIFSQRESSFRTSNENHEAHIEVEADDKFEQMKLQEEQRSAELDNQLKSFIYSKIDILLTTGEQMDDVAFATAHEVYSHRRAIWAWGLTKRVGMMVLFLALFVQNFRNFYYTQAFLSLDPNTGTCSSVAKSWTVNKLLASSDGYWQGTKSFEPNKAVYQFTMYSFVATQDVFASWMSDIRKALSSIAEKSKLNDLSVNLLLWASWTQDFPLLDPKTGVQTVQTVILNGDAQYIMNNEGIQGTVSSQQSDCNIFTSSQSYSLPAATLTSTIDISSMQADPSCWGPKGVFPSTSMPQALGWDKSVSGNTLTISIDVHALFTALAVSNRINGNDTLDKFTRITNVSDAIWHHDGRRYSLVDVYDSNYAGMAPVTCVGPTIGDLSEWNCFLRIGNSYGIPFLQHKGSNSTHPQRCDCSTSAGLLSACDKLNLLAGAVVFDHTRYSYSGHDSADDATVTASTVGAVFVGDTGGLSSTTLSVTNVLGGSISNGMKLGASSVTFTSCTMDAALNTGTCTLSSPQTITANTMLAAVGVSGTLISDTLLVQATSAHTIGNGMTITGQGVSGTVTLSSCYIRSGVGICRMSSKQSLGYAVQITATHASPTKAISYSSLYSSYPTAFQPILPLLEVFYVDPPISAKDANQYSYEAAFSALFGQDCSDGSKCVARSYFSDSTRRSDWYKYSDTWHYGTGTVIVFNSFSNLQVSISADNMQLKDGACNNEMFSSSSFSRLEQSAWGQLTEVYYQCTMNLGDAILSSLGIAAGTAGLLVPTCFYIIMFVAMGLQALQERLRGNAVKDIQHDFNQNYQEHINEAYGASSSPVSSKHSLTVEHDRKRSVSELGPSQTADPAPQDHTS